MTVLSRFMCHTNLCDFNPILAFYCSSPWGREVQTLVGGRWVSGRRRDEEISFAT